MLKEKYPAGGARKVGKERQLLLKTDAELRNGEVQTMDILVDTGAEANLIRKGLVSNHLTYVARNPLKFATANGQSLGGGDTCVKVKIRLQSDHSQDEWSDYEVEFYEASIRVDAILSYPWLAEMHLGVFPHHKALVQDSPHLKFL
jgi:hypothetical protein